VPPVCGENGGSDIVGGMERAWGWVVAALCLSALGMAATVIRASLLLLGEEGLEEAAEQGNAGAARLLGLVRDPSQRHPFSIWLAAAALKTASALAAGAAALTGLRAGRGVWGPVFAALWIVAYLLVLFMLENAATRRGLSRPDRVLRAGRPTLALMRGAAGLAALADGAGRLLLRGRYVPEALMDIRFGSEEGILTVIEEGAEHGTIDRTEEKMIEGILRFGDTTVSEEMTPRSRMVFLRQGASLPEVTRILGETGFSRYPVLSANGEEIVGVLTATSVFRAGEGVPWDRELEKPVYVPESMNVADLFRRFQRVRMHLAVVIDEHGMLCGIITVHDLLEKIVGRMDEAGDPGESPAWEKDGALSVPAATPVRVLREEYGIDIPLSHAYETAGGYAMDCLQEIPERRVTFRVDGYRITVTDTEHNRIRRLRFEKIPPTGTS
jgi:CBS domain containing-hemolysin-like protein